MRGTQMSNEHAAQAPSAGTVDTTLEVVVIPLSDVDRAKRLYRSFGQPLDANFAFDNNGSCNRATLQAWRFAPDIEGGQPVERRRKLARYFSGYRSRTTR
jgi:hypothetical protein